MSASAALNKPASAASALFAPGAKMAPYWWDGVRRRPAEIDPIAGSLSSVAGEPQTLPAKVDVLVIGSGYTGLHAALQTTRGGRQTLVVDAEDAGWGCSTRNGGQISTSVKPGLDMLARRYGIEQARAILRDGHRSLEWTGEFVAAERIDCGFEVAGRFHAAHNAQQYETLARGIANQPKGLESPAHVVPRSEQHMELGTHAYWGGVVYEKFAALDPARYHRGLLERVIAAGAGIVSHFAATAIERDGYGYRVTTSRGMVRARDVIVATNGYTGRLTPWLKRRVIPIGSYIIATEPLDPATMARLMPRNRLVTDTRKVVFYYRASPDRTRILFGGRVSSSETDPARSGPLLHAEMARIFRELAQVKISHSWCGFIAYTFDELPHIGNHEGIHYAMGYCGSGVGMAGYLGMKLGLKVLGRDEGRTGFDGIAFPTRPLYYGRPWFLGAALRYYQWQDRRQR